MSTSISSTLVKLRKDMNLSQKEAAKALGVSQALLSHYEKGIRECGLDFLCRASSFYDVTTDYLLGVSKTRISSDTLLDLSDIPQDKELKMSTILRAAAALLENVGNANSEKIKSVYILSIYKIYLSALNQEILPANSRVHPEITPFLSSSMLDYVLSTISSENEKTPKKLPVCVDTVVNEALSLLGNLTEALYNIQSSNAL